MSDRSDDAEPFRRPNALAPARGARDVGDAWDAPGAWDARGALDAGGAWDAWDASDAWGANGVHGACYASDARVAWDAPKQVDRANGLAVDCTRANLAVVAEGRMNAAAAERAAAAVSRRAAPQKGMPRRAALSALLAIASLAGGCGVDQQKEIDTYRRLLNPEGLPAPVPPADGRPMSLDLAFRLTNANNEQLALAGEDYLQTLIEKNRAAANFLPTISLSPSGTLADNPRTTFNGQSTGGGTNWTSSVPVAGQLNLFNGFRDVANLNRAAAAQRQREALLIDQQQRLLLNVAQTYFQVLRSEESSDVLINSVQYQEARLRDTEQKVRLGILRPLDLAQTRAELSATRVQRTQAQTDVRNARSTLGFLTGLPRVRSTLVDDYAIPDGLLDSYAFYALAEQRRYDLASNRLAIEVARQLVIRAIGEYYPTLSLDVRYLLARDPAVGGLWTAGLSANLPLFSAGNIEADVRVAWSQYRQAVLNFSLLRRQVFQEIDQGYADFVGSTQKLQDLSQQVDAAREQLRLADRAYELGSATNLERLDAQNNLLDAELQYASERFNRKTFYLALLRAAGDLGLRAAQTQPTPTSPTQPAGDETNPNSTQPLNDPTTQPLSDPTTFPTAGGR